MYIKFNKDDITNEQLKAIAAILELNSVDDLDWFYNPRFEACIDEIECVIDNNLSVEELKKLKEQSDYIELIKEYASDLYDISDNCWDELYNKAEEIIDLDDLI